MVNKSIDFRLIFVLLALTFSYLSGGCTTPTGGLVKYQYATVDRPDTVRRCKGFTKAGKPCRSPVVGKDGYCVWHHPVKITAIYPGDGGAGFVNVDLDDNTGYENVDTAQLDSLNRGIYLRPIRSAGLKQWKRVFKVN